MSDEKSTIKQLMVGILIFVCPVFILGNIFSNDKLAFTIGLLLGTALAFGQLFHMNYTIGNALNKTPKQAERFTITQYVIRNIVMVGFLVLAVFVDWIGVIGAIIGTFGVKASAFIYPYLERKNKTTQ